MIIQKYVDFLPVQAQNRVPLHLLRVRQQAVFECEWLVSDVDSLDSVDLV